MENKELEQINNSQNTQNSSDFKPLFDGNNDFIFLAKKTEKLAGAVYLITNLFSDSEPMKWTLRKRVSELLSFITTYNDIRQSELPNFIHISKTKVLEIISLLEVSLFAGLVSQMNFSIIKQEFFNLIELFDANNQKSDFSNNLLGNKFFEFDRSQVVPISTNVPQINLKDSGLVKDNTAFKSNNRQSIILGLLRKKKELTIKDIAVIIKDVSEKTIQRELISLIEAGVLRKTGERRWSKYSLNMNQ